MFKKGLNEQTPLRGVLSFYGEIPQNSCNAALVVDVINKITNKITKKTTGLVPQLPFIYWKGVVGVRVQRTADHFLKTLRLRTFPPRPLGETPARFVFQPRLTSIRKVLKRFSNIT